MKKARVAFSGSGFLVWIHAGAACALMDAGYDIIEVAGTSGGSIAAALVALGCKQGQLRELIQADTSKLLSLNAFSAAAFPFRQAMDSGTNLYNWLNGMFGGATFGQVKIPCTIVASDVIAGAPYPMNNVKDASMQLALACRASAAIPLAYAHVDYDGKYLVDGGLRADIPVDYLTINEAAPRIGINVDDEKVNKTSPIWGLLGSIVRMSMKGNDDAEIRMGQATGAKIINVPPPAGADSLDCKLSTAMKQALFDAGYETTVVST